MQSVTRFNAFKRNQQKFSMVTCYDYWSAQLIAASDIDSILVGDSLAVVMHGFPSTVHATLELMLPHVAAVARGAGDKLIVADMPFMTASTDLSSGVAAATRLIQAGAHAVKIEGATCTVQNVHNDQWVSKKHMNFCSGVIIGRFPGKARADNPIKCAG